MSVKTLSIPEDSLVDMLKTLPEKNLVNVFWKALAVLDTSPLTKEEKKAVKKARAEFTKEETIKRRCV